MKTVTGRNACEVIVRADMCVGCGICAAMCPVNVLEMRSNEYGEYVPVEARSGCRLCLMCLRSCPFWTQDDNEDSLAELAFGREPGIRHRSETGYYLKSFVGYVSDSSYRLTRSSGGVATWLQQTYLQEGLADYVISVVPNNDPNRLFRFAVLDTVDGVRRSARSAYYPVEMSGVVAEVLDTAGRYVITGLPCFLKGLRLAARHNAKLRTRIVCTIGLVCGQMKSKFFAEYLCAAVGRDPSHVIKVDFRCKSLGRATSEFAARFTLEGDLGPTSVISPWNEEYGKTWMWDYFKLGACSYCDDVFAETGDIAVMDAWLPEFTDDWRGTSLAIIRSPQVLAVVESAIAGGVLAMNPVGIDRVIKSQVELLANKHERLAHRLYLAQNKGLAYVPMKRVAPRKLSSRIDRWLLSCKDQMRDSSRHAFARLGRQRDTEDIRLFRAAMARSLLRYRAVRFIDRLLRRLPRTLIRQVFSVRTRVT